jgi:hypothetical protein
LAIWLYTLYRTFTEHFYASVGPNGHLVWNASVAGGYPLLAGFRRIGQDSGSISVLGLFCLGGLVLGLLYDIPNTLILIAVGVATMSWSLSRVSSKEFSSYWCYTAVAYSIAALFV